MEDPYSEENTVPPPDQYIFGEYHIDPQYRKQLCAVYPFYTSEEIVGSYLGYNPYFPSQAEWLQKLDESDSEN